MTIKDELIKELNSSYTKPFLIYDKTNHSPFNKKIEDILFSEDRNKYPFLGNILTDSIDEQNKELAYFLIDNHELRNFHIKILAFCHN